MKKGFTLIELLAVMVVLAILVIFVAPNIVNRLNDSKKEIFKTEIISLMKSAEQEYEIDKAKFLRNYSYGTGSLLVNTSDDIEYCVILNGDGSVNNITVVDNNKRFKGTATSEKDITVTELNKRESINCEVLTNNTPTVTDAPYKETLLHGTDPVLKGDLIPVILTSTDSDWTVTYADVKNEWYKYGESKWANAVRLVAEPSNASYKAGDVIAHEDISAYFVWIPRYKYKLFNMGNYNSLTEEALTPKNQLIDIVFGTETTIDTLSSCATPMLSGESGNCAVGKYMTHPAFISFNSNGFWVGKFETTGSTSAITVLSGVTSLRYKTVRVMFTNAYNYNRTLDSHMMKNTEWGAVAYLTNSSYGRGNTEIWINNNSEYKTGCVGESISASSVAGCENYWYSAIGVKGSTTGNITGIYDMSGGLWEYMAAYKDTYFGLSGLLDEDLISKEKYIDVYNVNSSSTNYYYRILGDATGEMGPFMNTWRSGWNMDDSIFIYSSYPWFERGGSFSNGTKSGVFYFNGGEGNAFERYTFRLVLTPQ